MNTGMTSNLKLIGGRYAAVFDNHRKCRAVPREFDRQFGCTVGDRSNQIRLETGERRIGKRKGDLIGHVLRDSVSKDGLHDHRLAIACVRQIQSGGQTRIEVGAGAGDGAWR